MNRRSYFRIYAKEEGKEGFTSIDEVSMGEIRACFQTLEEYENNKEEA